VGEESSRLPDGILPQQKPKQEKEKEKEKPKQH
jgi:hypothetical protein